MSSLDISVLNDSAKIVEKNAENSAQPHPVTTDSVPAAMDIAPEGKLGTSNLEPVDPVGNGELKQQSLTPDVPQQPSSKSDLNTSENERLMRKMLKRKVDDLTTQIDEMERQVIEVTRMRASIRKSKTIAAKAALEQGMKLGGKVPLSPRGTRPFKEENAKNKGSRARRMAELMRLASNVLRQIMQHKWAWPFLKPVDAQALGLHDYHQVIRHPMDFGTIRERMDAKDNSGYKQVQDICDDIRLVFTNALTYNQDGSDVYVMSKTLSERFEERWSSIVLPKLVEEEARRQQEEEDEKSKESVALQIAEEATADKLGRELTKQLEDIDKQLEEIKHQAAERCRPMTAEEKRQLGYELGLLPPEKQLRVVQIVGEKQPKTDGAANEVELDIDAQDPSTLWRLHRYVQSLLSIKGAGGASGTSASKKMKLPDGGKGQGARKSSATPPPVS